MRLVALHRALLMTILLLMMLVTAGEAPPAAALEEAAKQLSSPRFAEREAAMLTLWAGGQASERLLRDVVAGDDPEAAARAAELLGRVRFGVTPETPLAQLRRIEQYRRGDYKARVALLQQLHAAGDLEQMVRLIGATEPKADSEKLLAATESLLTTSVRGLLANEQWQRAEALLETLRPTEKGLQHWIAFHTARNSLDRAMAQQLERTRGADGARVMSLLCRAKGDGPGALRWAKESKDSSLIDGLHIEQQQWGVLSDAGTISAASTSHVHLEQLGQMALIHRWAGKPERQQAVVEEALQLAKNSAGLEQFAGIEVLLTNGRMKEGLELLKSNSPTKAIYYLSGQFRHDEAMRVAGAEPTEDGCRARIQKTIDAIRSGGKDRTDLSMAMEVIVLANSVGWTKMADESLESLAAVATDSNLRYTLISGMVRAGRRDMAFKYANSTRYRSSLFRSDNTAAAAWGVLLKSTQPQLSQAQIWRRIDQLLNGKGEAPDWAGLEKAIVASGRAAGANWHHLSRAARQRGEAGRWETYSRKATEANYAPAQLELGDALREQERWVAAAEAYRGGMGQASPVNLYLAGECLSLAGEQEEGSRLRDLALLLPLGDSRKSLATELMSRELESGAKAAWELDLRVLGPRTSEHANAALQLGDLLDELAPETSGRMWRLQLLSIMKGSTTFTNTISYARLPCMILRQEARLDIEAGRMEAAKAKLSECVRLMPMRISVAESLTPRLDALNRKDLGQWLYDQYLVSMIQATERFPHSALFLNNTAWLSATCGRDLEQAQRYSEKAVELEPESATYLDTLAEIKYRRGQPEEAIALMKRCLEMDRSESHFRRQLERFESGKP